MVNDGGSFPFHTSGYFGFPEFSFLCPPRSFDQWKRMGYNLCWLTIQ